MKEYKHFGVYGLIVENDKILLIKKVKGPYTGKLDLPGGTIEFCERPEETLCRELLEETGINPVNYELFDVDSVSFEWKCCDHCIKVHHTGIFYKVLNFEGNLQKNVELNNHNDDSMGADFFDICSLDKNNISKIAFLELKKLGYFQDDK